MTLHVIPIPAFKDNYIWLMHRAGQRQTVVIDPGDAAPVLKFLQQQAFALTAILLTHHHQDHVGGAAALREQFQVPVYGSGHETVAAVTHAVSENDTVVLPSLETELEVLDIPGHTRGHIAYYADGKLFCGDTLFAAGCGRLFEGTAEQLYHSLQKLAALPAETQIYCGHEYTQANLRFAQAVEPENSFIQQRMEKVHQLRTQQQPTLPSTLAEEKQTNPFLRCHLSTVKTRAEQQCGHALHSEVEIFAVLREWKNIF